MTTPPSVQCGQCGRVIDEAPDLDPTRRTPCPTCDSTTRREGRSVDDQLEIYESVRSTHKGDRPGVRGRRLVEGFSGESRSADGSWARVERTVDRVRRRYRERVLTADGRIVRDVDEPLEEHQGHGSAKERRPPG